MSHIPVEPVLCMYDPQLRGLESGGQREQDEKGRHEEAAIGS